MSDLTNALKNLIEITQKVVPQNEYNSDKSLISYTRAIVSRIARKDKNKKIDEFKGLTMDDIKYGFTQLYAQHEKEIEQRDFSWLAKNPICIKLGGDYKNSGASYPLSKVYALAATNMDKESLEAVLISCFLNSLGNKQGEKKEFLDKLLGDTYKDVFKKVNKDIDLKEAFSTVQRIIGKMGSMSETDLLNRDDVITAIIETLKKVEDDKQLNQDLKSLLALSTNKKVIENVQNLASKALKNVKL